MNKQDLLRILNTGLLLKSEILQAHFQDGFLEGDVYLRRLAKLDQIISRHPDCFSNTKHEVCMKITERVKNPDAVALGKLGGVKGGRARADNLTSEERTEIAKHAAQARWSKRPANISCPYCGTNYPYTTTRKQKHYSPQYKCSNNTCYKKFSLKTGTPLENTKLSDELWDRARVLCRSKISSVKLAKALDVAQKTAWYMKRRLQAIPE